MKNEIMDLLLSGKSFSDAYSIVNSDNNSVQEDNSKQPSPEQSSPSIPDNFSVLNTCIKDLDSTLDLIPKFSSDQLKSLSLLLGDIINSAMQDFDLLVKRLDLSSDSSKASFSSFKNYINDFTERINSFSSEDAQKLVSIKLAEDSFDKGEVPDAFSDTEVDINTNTPSSSIFLRDSDKEEIIAAVLDRLKKMEEPVDSPEAENLPSKEESSDVPPEDTEIPDTNSAEDSDNFIEKKVPPTFNTDVKNIEFRESKNIDLLKLIVEGKL